MIDQDIQIQNLNAEIETLKTKNQTTETEKNKLKEDLAQAKRENENLVNKHKEELQTLNNTQQTETAKLKEKMQAEINKLQEELTQTKASENKQKGKLQALSNTHQAEIARMKQENSSIMIQELKQLNQNLKDQIDKLKDQIEQQLLKDRNFLRNWNKLLELPQIKKLTSSSQKDLSIEDTIKLLMDKELVGDRPEVSLITDQSEFYDTIICMPSFHKLIHGLGWQLTRKAGSQLSLTGCKGIRICMIGNYNKGKTFLTSRLSGKPLPDGDAIHTKGISCIYADNSKRPLIFIDTAGFDVPLRLQKLETRNRQIMAKPSSSCSSVTEDGNRQIDDTEEQKVNNLRGEAVYQSVSDQRLQYVRDKQYTEVFIQQFVMNTSDIIIIVVNQLTFADQRLISRIVSEFRGKKKIFILHNFSELYTKNDVERYIKKDIINSFDVVEMNFAGSLASEEMNCRYWVEKNDDEDNIYNSICHIVFAREGTEAGPIYNVSGREILQVNIAAINVQKTFCIEDSLRDYLKDNLPRYLDAQRQDIEVRIDKSSLSTSDGNLPKQIEYIKVNCPKLRSLEFKQCNYDELGYLKVHFDSEKSQLLPYVFIQNNDSYKLIVEMPGFAAEDVKTLKFSKLKDKEGFWLLIQSKKKLECPEKDKLLISPPTMQFGEVICKTERIPFIKATDFEDKSTKELKDGLLIVTWKRKILTNSEQEEF